MRDDAAVESGPLQSRQVVRVVEDPRAGSGEGSVSATVFGVGDRDGVREEVDRVFDDGSLLFRRGDGFEEIGGVEDDADVVVAEGVE